MNIYLPTGSVLPGVHFISGLLTPSGMIGLGEALGRRSTDEIRGEWIATILEREENDVKD